MATPSPSLPPGQQLAAPGKWPTVGECRPAVDPSPWTVTIAGLVDTPRTWTLDDLQRLCRPMPVVDIHCVTRWSILGAQFDGVPLDELLAQVGPHRDARFASFVARSERNHSTSLPLAELNQLQPFVALRYQGTPLTEAHGGPVRMIVPGRYFYKSVKWLTRVELLADDRLGFWEATAGYHNGADPWQEQRFLAPDLNRQEAAALLTRRDLSQRSFRSLTAAGLDLRGLVARNALLRNADFSRSDLRAADFTRANLSNAQFVAADLRQVSFAGADVEGAEFSGADLREADFRGASLFGASFHGPGGEAIIDATTRFDHQVFDQLTPTHAEWLARHFPGPKA